MRIYSTKTKPNQTKFMCATTLSIRSDKNTPNPNMNMHFVKPQQVGCLFKNAMLGVNAIWDEPCLAKPVSEPNEATVSLDL